MRAAILVVLATAALAATPAGSQARRHGPAPAPTPRPQKCPYRSRLELVSPCSSPLPWRCVRCLDGVRITPRFDRCGAPIEVCKTRT